MLNTGWLCKTHNFLPLSRSIWKLFSEWTQLLWNTNRKSYIIYPAVSSLSYNVAWDRLWNRFCVSVCLSVCLSLSLSLCLSVCTLTVSFLDRFSQKFHGGKKPKNWPRFCWGLISDHPLPYYAPTTVPKRVQIGISSQITKDVELQCLGHVRPDHYAVGREDTLHQGDFVGGPNWTNNKSKIADGHHLGNTQAGVSRLIIDQFAPNFVCRYILPTQGFPGPK